MGQQNPQYSQEFGADLGMTWEGCNPCNLTVPCSFSHGTAAIHTHTVSPFSLVVLGAFWSYLLAGCVTAGTVSHPVRAGGASGRGNTSKPKLCQLWVYNAELIVLEWLLQPWAL